MSVVVGYVPDEVGLVAVQQAAREAMWRETDLVVVNVVDSAGFARPTAADDKTLDALGERLTETGVPFTVRHSEVSGADRPADAILAIAEETSAELVVVGIKRTSAVAKAVLGSTAQRVLMGAPCPVLTIRDAG
jgi:nucleotide-binding universal stress UspA family protein